MIVRKAIEKFQYLRILEWFPRFMLDWVNAMIKHGDCKKYYNYYIKNKLRDSSNLDNEKGNVQKPHA